MQGDTATLHLRRKVDADTWIRVLHPVPIRSNGQPLWKKHPAADIAVMYVSLPKDDSRPLLSTDVLADDKMLADFEIHPGDDLACLGYPFGQEANEAGFPVLRSGKIASYPLLPTSKTKTFLFDFRVFRGNSGGPVYFVASNRSYRRPEWC
jgi:S1-C subfamily serine protease